MSKPPADLSRIVEQFAHYLWYKTAVPVFLERGIIGACFAAIVIIIFTNPLKFDTTQKVTLGLTLIFLAYFAAHTVHRSNKDSKSDAPESTVTPTPTNEISELHKNSFELIGSIDSMTTGIPRVPPNSLSIILIVRVSNLGAPTIIRDWALQVVWPDHEPLTAKIRYIDPKEPLVMEANGNEPWVLSPDDVLYNKNVDNPLTSGGQVTGVIVFDLQNVSQADIYRSGTILNLSFGDVKGSRYKISYIVKNSFGDRPVYFPGMKPPPPLKKKRVRRK